MKVAGLEWRVIPGGWEAHSGAFYLAVLWGRWKYIMWNPGGPPGPGEDVFFSERVDAISPEDAAVMVVRNLEEFLAQELATLRAGSREPVTGASLGALLDDLRETYPPDFEGEVE